MERNFIPYGEIRKIVGGLRKGRGVVIIYTHDGEAWMVDGNAEPIGDGLRSMRDGVRTTFKNALHF